jgi:hypothetical protein
MTTRQPGPLDILIDILTGGGKGDDGGRGG